MSLMNPSQLCLPQHFIFGIYAIMARSQLMHPAAAAAKNTTSSDRPKREVCVRLRAGYNEEHMQDETHPDPQDLLPIK